MQGKKQVRGLLKYLGYEALKIISDTKNSRRISTLLFLFVIRNLLFIPKTLWCTKGLNPILQQQERQGTSKMILWLNSNPWHLKCAQQHTSKPNTKHQPFRANSGRSSSVWALGTPKKCELSASKVESKSSSSLWTVHYKDYFYTFSHNLQLWGK